MNSKTELPAGEYDLIDYKFNNKYGFATSIVSKAEQTATINGVSRELVTEMNLKVSYK